MNTQTRHTNDILGVLNRLVRLAACAAPSTAACALRGVAWRCVALRTMRTFTCRSSVVVCLVWLVLVGDSAGSVVANVARHGHDSTHQLVLQQSLTPDSDVGASTNSSSTAPVVTTQPPPNVATKPISSGRGTGVFEVPAMNSQAQLWRQKLFYGSLANFWSTVFMRTAPIGSVPASSSDGTGSSSEGAPSRANMQPATNSAGSPSPLSAAASSPSSASLSYSQSASSSSSSSSHHRQRTAPSYLALIVVVAIAVFVAMLLQYVLRRAEAAVTDEISTQYRNAVHSLYQQVVAVTLLCGVGIALASASFLTELPSSGQFGGDLQALLLDVSAFVGFTAVVFLCCSLALVGRAYACLLYTSPSPRDRG